MELGQFDYQKRPYTSSKVYDIHPLSKDGFTQYLSNDSYTHKYIKNKFDAQILEKLYGIETSSKQKTSQNFFNNSKNNNNSNNFNFNNSNINNLQEKDFDKESNRSNYNNKINQQDFDAVSKRSEKSENKNAENLKNNLQYNNNTTDNFYASNSNQMNKIINNNKNNFSEKEFENASRNKIKEINFNNNENNYDPQYKNTLNSANVDFPQVSKNEINKKRNSHSSYYNRVVKTKSFANSSSNNFAKFSNLIKNLNTKNNAKENVRFLSNYASNIAFLKKNQNTFFDFNPEEKELLNQNKKKRHDGFESFNIPRLENILQDVSKPSFQHSQRIARSCIGKRKDNVNISTNNNYLNNLNNFDLNNSNNKENSRNEKINIKIKEENQKLKMILNTQTNKDFLNRGNMPKISYVALQPKLVIKNFGLGGEGKFLGDKFNPGNFQTGRGNDRNRRNYVGGLYLN